MNSITYSLSNDIDLDAVIRLYRESTLGERRPVDNTPVMEAMIRNANLVITAWHEGKLVGLSRS